MTNDALARVDWSGFALTPVHEADVDQLNLWQNDPEIRDLTMGFRGPVQPRTTQEWVAATRGAGLGLGATALILDYGFNGLNLVRIGLEVLSDNLAARRLYEKLGFQHEGTKRSAYQMAGARHDVELYAILATDPQAPLPSEAPRLVFTSPPAPL